ncbi:AzlC family ABC transporter permease [Deinococcus radiopugnans]|uniref:4-azaleucine resistance transporter AzlC n=1 Tax=Deinococcus radiopugnans ATCC 19172 TaxID=585398 RepID=A0A5C4YBT7_9DEIO|nr:AzlC family ABC transporter permease [Deinococcus radiopugnans]MBB6015430.1 4-azaleucine resistance transporter AzlC [Deinococcus radiopugnans ATCC 19172]TNM72884.1 AzlC family ABC transporter permease [Deinococcus radiopugnans ATCC 19172]
MTDLTSGSSRLPPAFWRGLRAFVPLIPGVVPFGMVAGIAAVQAGFSPLQSMAFSVIGYAGSAQLIASQLFAAHTPVVLIVLATLVVNLRFAMYSASIRPLLAGVSAARRWPLAYGLTDQSYAVALGRPAAETNPAAYYAGAATLMWLTWQVGTAVGALLGARIPADWPLDFAVPLSFIALLAPVLRSRPQLLAAVVSALVAVAAHGLPFRLNLMLGALCGVAAGLLAQRVLGRRP